MGSGPCLCIVSRVVQSSANCFGGIAVAKTKYAKDIVTFYCRKCGEYHAKTHDHYADQQKRTAAKRQKA